VTEQPPILDYEPKPKAGPDRLGKLALWMGVCASALCALLLTFAFLFMEDLYRTDYTLYSRWKVVTVPSFLTTVALALGSIGLCIASFVRHRRLSVPAFIALALSAATLLTFLVLG
jgi:hypothetical protein